MIVVIEDVGDRKFTATYNQPDDYHFCLDSVIFAKFVAERIAHADRLRVLDVCAGCGVIGLEIAHHQPWIEQIDFLEKQNVFRDYFEANRQQSGFADRDFRFINGDFRDLTRDSYREMYDLIVANPPYFLRGEGRLSPSDLRNQCRFFLDGSLEELCLGLVNTLRPRGHAFLLVKDGCRHGRDSVQSIRKIVSDTVKVRVAAVIRGTLVVELTKSLA